MLTEVAVGTGRDDVPEGVWSAFNERFNMVSSEPSRRIHMTVGAPILKDFAENDELGIGEVAAGCATDQGLAAAMGGTGFFRVCGTPCAGIFP